jgi:hypothetical protein
MFFISFISVQSCSNFLLILYEQQIKAILENFGSSMYPDHFDWSGNGGLDAQSRKAGESVVAEFLQAHPTDYATKKLQVSNFYLFLSNIKSFTIAVNNIHTSIVNVDNCKYQ